jgi:hypothetical protein
LSWILLAVTLGVVCLGVALQWPGIALVLIFVFTPIVIRSAVAAERKFVSTLMTAISTLAGVTVAAAIGFTIFCSPVVAMGLSGFLLWLIGITLAVGVSTAAVETWLLIQFWLRKARAAPGAGQDAPSSRLR